jgi:CheY-like chemotaxis protein
MSLAFYDIVWLIDDDELANYVNESIIRSQHFTNTIVVFTTVDEALAALQAAVQQAENAFPDLIFLDMDLPGLDGWDFLEVFKMLPIERKRKCLLYMLSSSIEEADAERAQQYEEVNQFISKPLTANALQRIKSNVSDDGNKT